ncbi:MAG: hypothetical protein ABI699_16010 [Caldimonas sp.]
MKAKPFRYRAARHQGKPLHPSGERLCTQTGDWTYDDPAEHDAALVALAAFGRGVDLAAIDDWLEAQTWNAVTLEAATRLRALVRRHILAGNHAATRATVGMLQLAPMAERGEARRTLQVRGGLDAQGKDAGWPDRIERAIMERPDASNREIGQAAGCDESTVRRYKNKAPKK